MSNDPAVIAAKLVGMKNVGAHKSVVLTIHVPEELALRVIQAFGWPTMASPVDVAIAALDRDSIKALTIEHETPASTAPGMTLGPLIKREEVAAPIEGWTTTLPGDAPKPDRRPWSALTPTQQAAIRCGDPDFWDFLSGDDFLVMNALEAAQYVRQYCKVETRAELTTNPEAAEMWRRLDNHFLLRPKKEGHA
jgi:hypothetical protein